MLSRQTLSSEHAELAILAERMVAHVAAPGPQPALSATRWRLNRVLMLHLAKEDKLLYPALRRSSDAAVRRRADRFAEAMGGLAGTYAAYAGRWTPAEVEADWPGFAAATRTVMKALQTRILREEAELYPALGRT